MPNSSANALKHGLFAAHDLVAPDEHGEYAATRAAVTQELSPEGFLETAFANEIAGALWRLRRCTLVEFNSTEPDNPEAQKSTGRARAATQNSLRRCMAELRNLQTERAIRELIGATLPGLADSRKVLAAVRLDEMNAQKAPPRNQVPDLDNNPEAFDAFLAAASRLTAPPENSFCKNAESPKPAPGTPRNAPCPCLSGLKFKRCCGQNAPPVLSQALKHAA
jgi:hypothetical protein